MSRGLESLPSNASPMYYQCLLKVPRPGDILDSLSAANYRAILGTANPEAMAILALALTDQAAGCDEGLTAAVPKRKRRIASSRTGSSAKFAKLLDRPADMIVADSSGEESDHEGDESASEGDHGDSFTKATNYTVEGCRVMLEQHLAPGDRYHYRRYSVQCDVHFCSDNVQKKCRRRRCLGAAQCHAGDLEPIAFLGLWLSRARSHPSGASHKNFKPLRSDVLAYMRDHDMAFGEVV